MTDEKPLRASICPEDGCHALVPAEYRDNHAAGHASAKKSARAFRARQTALDLALAEVKDDNRIVMRKFEQFDFTPQQDPLEIEEWPETDRTDDKEEDDEADDTDADDTTETPAAPLTIVNNAYVSPIDPSLPTIGSPYSAIDRDDDFTPSA